jgi:GNAT superfamily N-acetyltransferase
MDPFAVRSASQPDAAPVAELWLRSRRAALDVMPAPVHSDAAVREWIASRVIAEMECRVAETAAGAIVGLLALDDDWVDQLYVSPDWQTHGVGSALLDQAKRLRPGGLQLWTFVSNRGACHFYEKRGFVPVEKTDGSRNEEKAPDARYVWEPGQKASPGHA